MKPRSETSDLLKELSQVIRLDAETGDLFWAGLKGARADRNGTKAGCLSSSTYLHFQFKGKKFLNHRVVFALHHGRWPSEVLDHINRNRLDNRPCNLREATWEQNNHNRCPSTYRRTTSRMGVAVTGKTIWAHIAIGGRRRYLGSFPSEQLAAEFRDLAEQMTQPRRPKT